MKFLISIGLLVVAFVLVLGGLGWYLAPRDELTKADAIVAISGGDTRARTLTAAGLYKDGWAPSLVVAGAAADPGSISNAVAMRRIAIAEGGVPSNVIRTEDDSRNTEENAYNVAETFPETPEKIILVTSPYHQRRAYNRFKVALPDTEIINYPAFDKTWRRSLWWITPEGWYLTISESVKLLYLNTTEI